MKFQEKEHWDPQRRPVLGCCTLCGGELYRGDACYVINGAVLCRGCLGEWAERAFAVHRAVCGEEAVL